jgi:hypothetical protein
MSVLAPAGLLALLLLLVILFLHLHAARYRGFTLSSTLLWSRVLADLPHPHPWRIPVRLTLLILQLLAVACGALALARPALDATGWHATVVVGVDTSLAMSATDLRPTRLARAQALVYSLIDGLHPWDTMTLVDVGASPRVLITSSDHAALRRAAGSLMAGTGPSSLLEDAPLLAGLQGAGGAHTTVRLLVPLGTSPAALDRLQHAVPALRVQTIGDDASDRAVAGLTVACPESGARGSCEAFARLINMGTRPITTRVTALVDGAPSAQVITLPARSSTPLRLAVPPGTRVLEVRLDGHDALAGDDTAWAVVPVPVTRTILLVTSTPMSPVAQAVRAIPDLRVLVLAPHSPALASAARRADLTVVDGGTVDGTPGNLLAVHPTGAGTLLGTITTVRAPTLGMVDTASPLLSGVDLSSLVLYTASTTRLPPWAHLDVASSAGPLLFDGTTDGRRVAALLVDPRLITDTEGEPMGSNLSALLAFPTLIQNAVQALTPAATATVPAGLVRAEPATTGVTTRLSGPSGRATSLAAAGSIVALPALPPGSYALRGGVMGPLAVNAPVPQDTGTPPQDIPASDLLAARVVPAAGGAVSWECWTPVLLLAVFLLSVEWWYYTRRT